MPISKRVLEGKNSVILNHATLVKIFEFYFNTELLKSGELGKVTIDSIMSESRKGDQITDLRINFEPKDTEG
jgi:hypothetical protein